MKVVGVYNLKGGTGKTTISVHLALAFAAAAHPTVLVGMDRQGDAIRWLTGGETNISNGKAVEVQPNLLAIFSGEEYPAALKTPAAAAAISIVVADLPPREDVAQGVPADLWIVPVDGRLALEDLMAVVDDLHETGGEVMVVFNRADAGGKRILGTLQRAASKIPRVSVWEEAIPDSAPIKRAGDLLRSVKEVPFGEGSAGDKALDALAHALVQRLKLSKPKPAQKAPSARSAVARGA